MFCSVRGTLVTSQSNATQRKYLATKPSSERGKTLHPLCLCTRNNEYFPGPQFSMQCLSTTCRKVSTKLLTSRTWTLKLSRTCSGDLKTIFPESWRKIFYRYIYAGKIENLNTRSPRLLEAADKYQLSELKEICEVGKNRKQVLN